jgi:cytochrome c
MHFVATIWIAACRGIAGQLSVLHANHLSVAIGPGNEPMMSWISTVSRRLARVPAFALMTAFACALVISAPVHAGSGKPTQDEVEALTRKAAAIVESQGVEAARELFNKDGEFKYGEIYVNVIDFKGTWLIYPPRPASIGQNVINLRDADGRSLIQDIVKVAREKGEGWTEYRWINPVSNRVEMKLTYVKRVADKDIAASIGIYK